MTVDNFNETLQRERAFYQLVHLMRYNQTAANNTTEQLQALAGYSQEIS
jgi:hypothetical protein